MIRPCDDQDFDTIYTIVNDAAQAYKGVIPADCWTEPYMPEEELRHEIGQGIAFWGYENEGGEGLLGVMGIQHLQDVTLIRHAYVRTSARNRGIGTTLLSYLREQTSRPVLIGAWADALWAIHFYEKRGFCLTSPQDKYLLLRRYWTVSDRQIETSVVLVDQRWFASDHSRLGFLR